MKKTLIENVRTRGYKLLLYADNPLHMRVLSRIRRDPDLRQWYVGCWHIQRDKDGCEIVTGAGKKHVHIILDFPNPRYWHNVCRTVGLVTAEGAVDPQFCRAIGYEEDGSKSKRKQTVNGGYVYLVHANKPDAEQYLAADLFGDPVKLEDARAAIVAYQMRNITLSESLSAIRKWINEQYGKIVTPDSFVAWVTQTPYVRSAQNPWVNRMIESHNARIYRLCHKDMFGEISQGYKKLEALQNGLAAIDIEELSDDELEGLY